MALEEAKLCTQLAGIGSTGTSAIQLLTAVLSRVCRLQCAPYAQVSVQSPCRAPTLPAAITCCYSRWDGYYSFVYDDARPKQAKAGRFDWLKSVIGAAEEAEQNTRKKGPKQEGADDKHDEVHLLKKGHEVR